MKKPTNAQIRQFITTYFNDAELIDFCFDYFPEVKDDFGEGMTKSQKVRMLIGYCQRRDLETNLLINLRQERPQPFAAHFPAEVEALPAVETKSRNPRQIFISHAHEDGELAQRLAHDLEAEGWPVWIAPDSIQPGEKWASAISRGLDESGIFVLLLTPHAVKSRWVRSETDVAVEMEHEGEMRFIPLLVEACRVPALWRAYQRIPFRAGYDVGLAALLAALAGRQQASRSGRSVTEPGSGAIESGTARRPATAENESESGAVRKPATAERNSFIHEKTGLEFVRIPAGEFLYGDNKERKHLPEFWMGKTPVTNEAYARFVKAKKYKSPRNWNGGQPPADKLDHPVVYVSRGDAQAFCEWAGLRLPRKKNGKKRHGEQMAGNIPGGIQNRPVSCVTLVIMKGARRRPANIPRRVTALMAVWI